MILTLILFLVETLMIWCFSQFLPGGVIFYLFLLIFFFNIFCLFIQSPKLVKLLFIFASGLSIYYGVRCWRISSHAEHIVAELEKQNKSAQITIQSGLELIKKDRYFIEYFSNFEIDEEGDFYLFFHYLTPSIAHWYDSKYGWNHSDD